MCNRNQSLSRFLSKVLEYLVYILIVSLPFSKALVEICSVGIIGLWVIEAIVSRSLRARLSAIKSTPIFIPCVAYFIMCLISLCFSQYLDLSVRALFTKVIKVILISFCMYDLSKNEIISIRRLGFSTLSIVVLVCLDALWQLFFGFDFLRGYHVQTLNAVKVVQASFANPNNLAGWLIMVLPLTILFVSYFHCNWTRKKIIMFSLISLGGYVLLRTNSRGAVLALFLTAGFLFLVHSVIFFWSKRQMVIRICLFLVFFSVTILCGKLVIGSGFFSTDSSIIRLELWEKAWHLAGVHHFIGSGINTYSKVTHAMTAVTSRVDYPHNSYLKMLVEIGVQGLAAFVWIILAYSRSVFLYLRQKRDAYFVLGIVCGIYACLAHSFVNPNLAILQLSTLLWTFLGISLGLMEREKEENRE